MSIKQFFKLFLILFLFISANLFAQKAIPSIDQIKTEPVNIGYSFTLYSEIMGEDRIIQVCLPDGYADSDKRYPVLYMVDGQWNFNLSTVAQGTISDRFTPPMILVSVHTLARRNRDLLPPLDDPNNSGGEADKMLKFFTDELAPFVEKNYRTYPYRTIFGSSFGGVFVMHALTSDPNSFDAYIATSPSIWWGNRILLDRTKKLLQNNPDLDKRLFITVANEGMGMGVNDLAKTIKKNAPKNFKWKFEEYPDEVHETVSYRGLYRGLKFLFDDWSPEPVNLDVKGHLVNAGDEVIVKMKSKAGNIHYTLDGSAPTIESAIYKKPLTITKPTTLKAMPITNAGLPGKTSEYDIKQVQILQAETDLPQLKPGISYAYFEGNWEKMPKFGEMEAIETGTTTDTKILGSKKSEMFGFQFNAYFDAPKDDLYMFFLGSDDGSQLLIGDNMIIDNDGLHGMEEKIGSVYLKKGKHKITVNFFQGGGGFDFSLAFSTEKTKRTDIMPNMLFCKE